MRLGVAEVFGLQGQELIVILIIILVLFGGRKIPELMRSIGEGLREFRRASQEAVHEIQKAAEASPDDTGDEAEGPTAKA